MLRWSFPMLALLLSLTLVGGEEKSKGNQSKQESRPSVERGKKAMLSQTFVPPMVTRTAWDRLWKVWGEKTKPADFEQRLLARYGLHKAPYPNNGAPMGLRDAKGIFGKGLAQTCLMCHAGSICGESVIGLGNASLDLELLFHDLGEVQGIKFPAPFSLSQARGTMEATALSEWAINYRDNDLNPRTPVKKTFVKSTCEDVPAWWLLKKKKTMYHTGNISTDCTRTLMSFMINPFNSADYIKSTEPVFRDMKAYLNSLKAPKYPFEIDEKQAAKGKVVFEKTCSRCHGTYGPKGEYPNRVVSTETVGTDPTLADYFTDSRVDEFNQTWLAKETDRRGKAMKSTYVKGYQAPPLDGVWATAPYFHNASVPTLYHVLNSKSRPKIFTRSYRTGREDYDQKKVGWKITALKQGADKGTSDVVRRKIYNTTLPGRSNQGHRFGDRLSEAERMALIEYLKTL